LAASKKILEQKNIPVIIVSSEFCKSYAINKREYDSFQDATHKPGSRKIGKAICEDMKGKSHSQKILIFLSMDGRKKTGRF
jgi:hypothetical protein